MINAPITPEEVQAFYSRLRKQFPDSGLSLRFTPPTDDDPAQLGIYLKGKLSQETFDEILAAVTEFRGQRVAEIYTKHN